MIEIRQLPDDPGCYLYKNVKGQIIYVGKAKNLKKRVSSYFTKTVTDAKTALLVSEIASVDYFVTNNEVEALVLENNLIKKHRPKYNIDLKDDKRYAHLVVTAEKFPRLIHTRRKNVKGKFFGPFVSGERRNSIARSLQQVFRLRTCRTLPKRECLRYHIGLCSAPCIGRISEEDYVRDVRRVEEYLSGNSKDVLHQLRVEMGEAAKEQRFERAKSVRDQIESLEALQERQHVELDEKYTADLINFLLHGGKVAVMVFRIDRGVLTVKDEFIFEPTPGYFEEFVVQYYATREIPREVILPRSVYDESIQEYLTQKRGGQVRLVVPERGLKRRLLDLVRRNLITKFVDEQHSLTKLRDLLHLPRTPVVIECFDISHMQGTDIVASMVQFRGGKPEKENYRHFKLRTVDQNDDFASMREVVYRRYAKLKAGDEQLPDLVVIDGGLGQLRAALEALQSVGVCLPVISLAKREEEVYVPGKSTPLRLKRTNPALKVLMYMRDEAHRFAVTFQRKQRSMRLRDEFNDEVQD